MVTETHDYKSRVKTAVADPKWQEFRKGLKGLSTQDKLTDLRQYFERTRKQWLGNYTGSRTSDYSKYLDASVQVDNYIKSLCRGGQLHPGESLQTIIQKDWAPKIKK